MESNPTTYTCPITTEEHTALAKFIDLLKAKKIEYDTQKMDNAYLVRFLRARKSDLNKTLEMFTNHLKWRKDNNVDEVQVNYKHIIIRNSTFMN